MKFNPLQGLLRRISQHRANWSFVLLQPWIKESDRVLDVGTGDCLLDQLLSDGIGCQMTLVDVEDANTTTLPLTVYDGNKLPFADDSFDVAL